MLKKKSKVKSIATIMKKFVKNTKVAKKLMKIRIKDKVKMTTVQNAIKTNVSRKQKVLYDAHVKAGDFLQELQDFKNPSISKTNIENTFIVDTKLHTDTHKADLYSLLMSFYKKGFSHGYHGVLSKKKIVSVKRKKKRK